ncbi:MAG: holo-ACP synthase [Clostridia bacterium]|nr:holo-ACP synthase [Clostridia bacterium]
MNITCGTDIVEIDRIKKAVNKTPSFVDRIYTSAEQDYCLSKKAGRYSSLAARFAAKEAVAKALGTGMGDNASPLEIEIKNDDYGKPFIVLSGAALKTFNASGAEKIDVSLSHGRDYAVAFAVITYKEEANE